MNFEITHVDYAKTCLYTKGADPVDILTICLCVPTCLRDDYEKLGNL